MKKLLKFNIAVLALYALSAQVWASESALDENELFPQQPSLIYKPRFVTMNPFKMSSFSIGGGGIGSCQNLKNIFQISLNKAICEINTEVPYYRDRVSLGFGFSQVFDGMENASTVLFSLKGRLPVYTPVGLFGLGLISKLGPSSLKFGNSISIGGSLAIGVGLDYYLNQWVGCYAEYSVCCTYVPFFIEETQHSFSSKLVVGIKTTF